MQLSILIDTARNASHGIVLFAGGAQSLLRQGWLAPVPFVRRFSAPCLRPHELTFGVAPFACLSAEGLPLLESCRVNCEGPESLSQDSVLNFKASRLSCRRNPCVVELQASRRGKFWEFAVIAGYTNRRSSTFEKSGTREFLWPTEPILTYDIDSLRESEEIKTRPGTDAQY
jgi:hypothetical protein